MPDHRDAEEMRDREGSRTQDRPDTRRREEPMEMDRETTPGDGGRQAGYQTLDQEAERSSSQTPDRASTGRDDAHANEARLIPPDNARTFEERWMEIQGRFVDDPQGAARDADQLTADVVERLTSTLQTERNRLVSEVEKRQDVSTEDLRQAVQRYRAFFQRLLSM